MTRREQEILAWIRDNPLISQQELAQRAGITRSSVAVHISNLMRKGLIRGRGYLLGEGAYVAVVGAGNVDIGGTPDSALVPADSNPGRVTVTLGGVGRNIAENLSRSLAEYFALPFIYPMTPRTGTVVTERDALNVRAYPAMSGQVVGSVPHEAQLTVYGQTDGWYSMGYGNLAGYVRSEYVRL